MNDNLESKRTSVESGLPAAGREHQQAANQLRKRIAALWVAVVALAVILSGVTGYGYLALHKHGLKLDDLPGLQESVALVGERVDALEAKARDWAARFDAVNARVDKLERKANYNRELARTEARKAADQVQHRLEAQMKEKAEALDARVTLLESGQEAERARLGQLREEVAAVRRDTGHDLSRLHRQLAHNEQDVTELARSLEPVRVDFELRKDRTQEIAQGVSLRVTGTSVDKQQVKGWVWLMPDRKTLWVRDLGIQQPLRFYHKDGTGPHELVFTRVGDDHASGYLLLKPQRAEEATADMSVPEREGLSTGTYEESVLR